MFVADAMMRIFHFFELNLPVFGQKAHTTNRFNRLLFFTQMDAGDTAIGLHMVLTWMWGKTFPTGFNGRER